MVRSSIVRLAASVAAAVLVGIAPMQAQTARFSSDPVTARIIEEGLGNNRTMEHLDVLCNRFGGRLIGSAAYDDACTWAASQFEKWGFEVHWEEVGTLPTGFNRGPWFGRMIGGSGMTLHFVTPSYTSGTRGVQRGHVVKEPHTTAEFERMKGTFKDAWVLIDGTSSGFPIDWSDEADARRDSVIAYNDAAAAQKKELKSCEALFYRRMIEAGALGFIQAADIPLRSMYDRKNLEKITFDNLPSVPDIKLDRRQYDEIRRMVEDREYFQLEFDIRNHFRPGPVKYHNIIAIMRGSEFPDEYVMVGGHLDAYDSATGGVDCGVGSTVALEVGRLLSVARAKPRRTIVLCLWAGEEFGLYGSKWYVENHPEQMKRISNYFNRDGGPTMSTGIAVPPAMYDDFKSVCAPLESIYGFTVVKNEAGLGPRPKKSWGADTAYFAMKGVPVLSFTQGDPKGYNFDYREIWHTERDTYDRSIAEYQEATSVITAVTAYGIANLDHLLDRTGVYSD